MRQTWQRCIKKQAALLGRMQLMRAVHVSHAQALLGRSRWVPISVMSVRLVDDQPGDCCGGFCWTLHEFPESSFVFLTVKIFNIFPKFLTC